MKVATRVQKCSIEVIRRVGENGVMNPSIWTNICGKFLVPQTPDVSRKEKPTRCHWMIYCTYNMLNVFRAFLCTSSGARDYMCALLPPMVCNALVAGGRRSGAGQKAMHPEWGMLLEQHPSSRTHSLLSWTWPPTASNQGIAHHRR